MTACAKITILVYVRNRREEQKSEYKPMIHRKRGTDKYANKEPHGPTGSVQKWIQAFHLHTCFLCGVCLQLRKQICSLYPIMAGVLWLRTKIETYLLRENYCPWKCFITYQAELHSDREVFSLTQGVFSEFWEAHLWRIKLAYKFVSSWVKPTQRLKIFIQQNNGGRVVKNRTILGYFC